MTVAPPSPVRPLPAYSPLIERFLIDRNLVFLNHGSFGAVPAEVLQEQEAIRRHVERDPVRFFVEELEPRMDAARRRSLRSSVLPQNASPS
ncbi:MAG: hypothetical protein QM783_16855 [Phycisphaerales bacterium]